MNVRLLNADEHSGYEVDPTGNPEATDSDSGNGLDYGTNIAFKVPTTINFVSRADGELIVPDASAVYVENLSVFADHVSSLEVVPQDDWNFVSDAGRPPRSTQLI